MPRKRLFFTVILAACLACLGALKADASGGLDSTSEIIGTSAAGARLDIQPNVQFLPGTASGTVIQVYPDSLKQTIDGIGSSLTESSAFVLAHLDLEQRAGVMRNIFGAEGANFSLTRTHIGACDFSVKGRYSYADVPGDAELKHFNLAHDKEGFDPAEYPGLRDAGYDFLPLIKEALAVKSSQADPELKILASAWTAPSWMKDIQTWYIPGTPENTGRAGEDHCWKNVCPCTRTTW
jgi:glucosylceramidase